MKHGKRPSLKQKKEIALAGLNPEHYLVVKNRTDYLVVMRRETGKIKVIRRN